jgi:hypothetical protein
MVRVSGDNETQPKGAGQSNGFIATMSGCNLPDSVLRVKEQASPIFRDDSALRSRIHIARPKLVDIRRKQTDTMRIHSAQICGNEGRTGQLASFRRCPGGN